MFIGTKKVFSINNTLRQIINKNKTTKQYIFSQNKEVCTDTLLYNNSKHLKSFPIPKSDNEWS